MEGLALKRRMGGSAVASEKVVGVGGLAEAGIISVAYVMIALPRMFFTFCLFVYLSFLLCISASSEKPSLTTIFHLNFCYITLFLSFIALITIYNYIAAISSICRN